jgi:hypothetical protein
VPLKLVDAQQEVFPQKQLIDELDDHTDLQSSQGAATRSLPKNKEYFGDYMTSSCVKKI